MTPQEQAVAATLHQQHVSKIFSVPAHSAPNTSGRSVDMTSRGLACNRPAGRSQLGIKPVQLHQLYSTGQGMGVGEQHQQMHSSMQYRSSPIASREPQNSLGTFHYLDLQPTHQFVNLHDSPSPCHTSVSRGNHRITGTILNGDVLAYRNLQQSISSPEQVGEPFDSGSGIINGSHNDEMLSTTDRSSGSSNRSGEKTSRWKPNSTQLFVLERHFTSGQTKATPELVASVQGCGQATQSNVVVWLKNRLSRMKIPSNQVVVKNAFSQDENSDDDDWSAMLGDFRAASESIMHQVSSAVLGMNQTEVQILAQMIQNAELVCTFGAGKEALVMKDLAVGLHHLGYNAYYAEDTNIPQLDSSALVLISAGPAFRRRISGLIDEALSSESKVAVFSEDSFQAQNEMFVVHIPTTPINQIQIGSDGEVVSRMSPSLQDHPSLFDLNLSVLCECICVMLRKACGISSAEIRARHTNLE